MDIADAYKWDYEEADLKKLREKWGNSPRKAIRMMCYQCSGYSYPEVKLCEIEHCPLFQFRMGSLPVKRKVAPPTEKQLEVRRQLAERARGKGKGKV